LNRKAFILQRYYHKRDLALFNIHPALKQELKQQRRIIFGNKRFLFHIIMWLAALCYLVLSILGDEFRAGVEVSSGNNKSSPINSTTFSETPFFAIAIISSLVGAVMVYFYLLIVIPFARYKKQRRYLWIGVIINLALWLLVLITAAVTLGMAYDTKTKLDKDDMTLVFMLSAVFSGVVAGVFFSLYYFLDLYDQQKSLNKYRKVFTEKLEAETNFLKTQINPHFLFNTLNNIYSLTLSQSSDAAFITRQLKNLITYMLQDCTNDLVPLTGEIAFLKNYITLEQLRNKQEQIDIQLTIKGESGNKKIAPLLLINFVENAFKHGVKAGISNAFVKINLLIMGHVLALEIVNSKPEQIEDQQKSVKEDGGIGIQNVSRRLDILYPHRHKLRISESKKEYSVYLSIDL
jgi:two-component system, LytTR family, sensor kinase